MSVAFRGLAETAATMQGPTDADAGRKVYFAGTHRVCAPEQTLERVVPLMAAMGITRVGDITGLDHLGIPVAIACRPNSRSLAVFQGKGLTRAAAKVSALMEAAEVYHAETIAQPLQLASVEDLRRRAPVVDVDALPRAGSGHFEPTLPIPWIEGRDVASGEPVWVPYEIVMANYTVPEPIGRRAFLATTNGLGSGNHALEAVGHGLHEVIERDAVTLWRRRGAAARHASAIDPASIDDPDCLAVLALFARARVAVRIWNATSDIGVPAFVCLAVDEVASATDPELGAGCHPDKAIALLRAMTEAAQARTTWIAGSRDDFEPDAYRREARKGRAIAGRDWLNTPQTGDFRAIESLATATLRGDLAVVVARLRAVGIGSVIAVDLTRPELGIPVVRVIVPGLEGPILPGDNDYVPGRRACARQP